MGEQILAHKYLLADYYARIRAHEKAWRKTQRGKYSIPQPVFRRLLFLPDYDRRLRICTGSADPFI